MKHNIKNEARLARLAAGQGTGDDQKWIADQLRELIHPPLLELATRDALRIMAIWKKEYGKQRTEAIESSAAEFAARRWMKRHPGGAAAKEIAIANLARDIVAKLQQQVA